MKKKGINFKNLGYQKELAYQLHFSQTFLNPLVKASPALNRTPLSPRTGAGHRLWSKHTFDDWVQEGWTMLCTQCGWRCLVSPSKRTDSSEDIRISVSLRLVSSMCSKCAHAEWTLSAAVEVLRTSGMQAQMLFSPGCVFYLESFLPSHTSLFFFSFSSAKDEIQNIERFHVFTVNSRIKFKH